MILNEPYFLTNESWYYYDEDELMYKLTDEAPPKARESYAEFYAETDGDEVIDR